MSDTPKTDAFEDSVFLAHQITWTDFARTLERELADAKADTARLDWLFQDAELNLFFADRDEIDAAMQETSK